MRSAYGLDSGAGVDWLLRAACRDYDYEWWSVPNAGNERARRICRQCPVRTECLDRAERLGSTGMIVAGRTLDRLGQTHLSGKHYRMCVHCRSSFLSPHAGRIYCRNACRVAAGNLKRTERRRHGGP